MKTQTVEEKKKLFTKRGKSFRYLQLEVDILASCKNSTQGSLKLREVAHYRTHLGAQLAWTNVKKGIQKVYPSTRGLTDEEEVEERNRVYHEEKGRRRKRPEYPALEPVVPHPSTSNNAELTNIVKMTSELQQIKEDFETKAKKRPVYTIERISKRKKGKEIQLRVNVKNGTLAQIYDHLDCWPV